MKDELDIIRDVSERLAQARVAYMLTGSMAMNHYAQPRMTRDIDLVIALNGRQVAMLVQLFAADYYVAEAAVASSVEHQSIFNLIHNESLIKVDCIVRKRTEYRLLEFERRREIQIRDFMTFIVSKEDLIISKLEWAKDSHSELQLRDVRNLLSTGCDAAYLERWARALDLESLLKECRHE